MIVRPRPGLLTLFFVMRGSIVPRIAPHIIGFALYAAAIVWAMQRFDLDLGRNGLAPFTLLGVTLSIYLGFRNNAAYDRWWEARKLWGQLIYEIRNLARTGNALIPPDAQQLRPLLMEALAFCHLLRGDLRNVDAIADAGRFIADGTAGLAAQTNKPDAMLRRMGQRLAQLRQRGELDPMAYRILDERLSAIAATQAGCERIANTPLPFAYTLLVHRSAYIFCLLLPFGMATAAGWGTPLFTAMITYSFFGLDVLSEEMEDPFGNEANDLPLDGLCRTCEIAVFEALGEPPPSALPASHFVFS